jgi:hypothetical protein
MGDGTVRTGGGAFFWMGVGVLLSPALLVGLLLYGLYHWYTDEPLASDDWRSQNTP